MMSIFDVISLMWLTWQSLLDVLWHGLQNCAKQIL